MSRTYRRKNGHSIVFRGLYNHSQSDRQWVIERNPKAKDFEESVILEESKYHRDNHPGRFNFSKWNRRQFKIIERMVFRSQFARFLRDNETEIQSFPLNKIIRHAYY